MANGCFVNRWLRFCPRAATLATAQSKKVVTRSRHQSNFLDAGDSELSPIVAKQPDQSELWRRLVTDDADLRMPVDAEPLTASQLASIKAWIEAGAPVADEDLGRQLSGLAMAKSVSAPEHYPRPLPVNALALTGDGKQLLIGGYAEVTRWDVATGELLARIPVAGPHVAALAIAADGKQLAVSSGSPGQRGVIQLVSLEDGAAYAQLDTTEDVAADLAWSPSGQRVAIGDHDGSLRVVELQSDHRIGEVKVLTPHADAVLAVAWSADGGRLLTASRDRTAKLFDSSSMELIASYDRHERAVGGVAFLGKRPLSFDETGRLRMMAGDDSDGVVAEQASLPRVLQKIAPVGDEVFIADRSRVRRLRSEKKKVSDGKTDDGKPKTKDVTRLNEKDAFHSDPQKWITAVSGTEHFLAAGTQQGTVIIWDLRSDERIAEVNVTP